MATELERHTRKQRIDPRLKAAGWSVVPFRSSDLHSYKRVLPSRSARGVGGQDV